MHIRCSVCNRSNKHHRNFIGAPRPPIAENINAKQWQQRRNTQKLAHICHRTSRYVTVTVKRWIEFNFNWNNTKYLSFLLWWLGTVVNFGIKFSLFKKITLEIGLWKENKSKIETLIPLIWFNKEEKKFTTNKCGLIISGETSVIIIESV